MYVSLLLTIFLTLNISKGQNDLQNILIAFFKTEYFPASYPVVVLMISSNDEDKFLDLHLQTIFATANRKIFIVNQFTPYQIDDEKFILILNPGNNTKVLIQHLQKLKNSFVFNPKIVIWCEVPMAEKTVEELFQECAKALLVKTIVFHPKESNMERNSAFQIQLRVGNIFQYLTNPQEKIHSFYVNKSNIEYTLHKIDTLLQSYSMNLEGKELTIMAVPQRVSVSFINKANKSSGFIGVDICALHLIAEQLNFTPRIVAGEMEQYGYTFRNGSYTRAMRNLMEGRVFMNINRYLIPSQPHISLVWLLNSEAFCFILNNEFESGIRWILLSGFHPLVWLAFCFTVATFCAFWRLFKGPRAVHYPIITLFQALTSVRSIKLYSIYQRVLWTFWLLFVYMIYASITGTIVTQIMKPTKKYKLKTLQELLESNITIMSNIGQFNVAQNNSIIISIMDKAIDLLKESLHVTTSEQYYSAVLTSTNTRIHFDNSCKVRHTQCYYILPECVYYSFSGYTMSSHNPLLEAIQKTVCSFVEHGFYRKWLSHYKFNQTLGLDSWEPLYNITATQTLIRFSLNDLFLAFTAYFVGILIALGAFIAEISFYELNKKN